MRVLVATVVHTPLDARIHARQVGALRAAGHDVTYAAPWSATGTPPNEALPGVSTLDLPRAVGRDRGAALRAARRVLAEQGPRHHVVLLHDPELLLAVAGLRQLLRDHVVVWDVHEDTGAALVDKPWLPEALRPAVRGAVGALESWAQRRLRLLLAEERYADRLTGGPDGTPHPVVPNTPVVPAEPPAGPADPPFAIQVGRLSRHRGVEDLLEVGRLLAGEVALHLVGQPDPDVADEVRRAHEAGHVVFHGFVPNDRALAMVEGAVAGLSLLRDLPNYRQSMPTKLYEYLGRAVPAVTTPLPAARALVEASDGGILVPFADPTAAAAAVRELASDRTMAHRRGESGHQHVLAHHAWNTDGPAFVHLLEGWVAESSVRIA